MKNRYFIMMYISLAGLFLTSCYKTFDPASYAPKFTISGFSSVNQIKSANLIDYWAFQGGLIDSVSGVAATNSGTTFVNGFIGKAIGSEASNESYVTTNPTNALKSVQSFTISFWVNPTFVDVDGNGQLDGAVGLFNIANANDFWGYLDWFADGNSTLSSPLIKLHLRGGALDTWIVQNGVAGFFGKWSNHTITYDATTSQLIYYMNGAVLVPATTVPWTGAVDFSGIGPLIFGTLQFQTTPSLGNAGGNQTWASWLTGSLDEIRIYNAALTPTEVNALVVLQGKSGK